jgi:hypothetical protein
VEIRAPDRTERKLFFSRAMIYGFSTSCSVSQPRFTWSTNTSSD